MATYGSGLYGIGPYGSGASGAGQTNTATATLTTTVVVKSRASLSATVADTTQVTSINQFVTAHPVITTSQTVTGRASLSAVATRVTSTTTSKSASLTAVATLVTSVARTRVTQAGVEIVIVPSPSVRVTQTGVEIIVIPSPKVYVTQAGVEIIVPNYRFVIPIPAITVLTSVRTRVVPSTAKLGAQTFTRTLAATARLSKTLPRSIIATARFRTNNHFTPAFARFKALDNIRAVPASAEIGNKRFIPATVSVLGTKGRSVPSYAVFRQAGLIPARASFWSNAATTYVVSDANTRIMSIASRVVGGSIGHYIGYPQAINGVMPAGWDAPGYTGPAFQPPLIQGPLFFPFPYINGDVRRVDFNWGWPNPTNDYAPNFASGGDHPVCDPWNDMLHCRAEFGLPLDPMVASHTTGVVQAASWGTLINQVRAVRINGHNLPFVMYQINNPGFVSGVWNVPSSVLLPGSNVLAVITSSYISANVNSRAAQFLLTLSYKPLGMASPQVIG